MDNTVGASNLLQTITLSSCPINSEIGTNEAVDGGEFGTIERMADVCRASDDIGGIRDGH
jgi:hypothetical protein